jgi:hypothetical protein
MEEQTETNQEPNSRTIIANPSNHERLSLMKITGHFKSIDDVITLLLKEHEELKAIKETSKPKDKSKNGKRK